MTTEVVDTEAATNMIEKKGDEDVIELDDDDVAEIPKVDDNASTNADEPEPMQVDKEEPEIKPEDAAAEVVNPDEADGIKMEDEVKLEVTAPLDALAEEQKPNTETDILDIIEAAKPKADSDVDSKTAVEGSQCTAPSIPEIPKAVGNGNGEEAKQTNGKHEDDGPPAKVARMDLQSVPTRQYLDQTVVPILLHGMAALSKDRPTEPIEYLAEYLLKHKAKYDSKSAP